MRLKIILRQRRGSAAVEVLMTTAILLLVFAVLVSALVYVMQYYTASYVCRRVTRSIETTGKYDASQVQSLISELSGDGLANPRATVTATFLSGKRIQLRQPFSVTLTASYRIAIFRMGQNSVYVNLPITVKVAGMSEVYWR